MPLSFLLHQQVEVLDDYVEDLPRGEQPVSVVEVERTSVSELSLPVPPHIAPAPPETASPSSSSQNQMSTSLSLLGSSWLLWMLFVHLLLLLYL